MFSDAKKDASDHINTTGGKDHFVYQAEINACEILLARDSIVGAAATSFRYCLPLVFQ